MAFKNTEKIKEMIMEGKRRGVCNGEGESLHIKHGQAIAKPTRFGSTAKTYVYRNGLLVEK